MSTTSTHFGSAEAQAARSLIGGTAIGDTRNELLKQVLVAVANKASGGGGGAAWGAITGTLSNQTDLANALAAKLSLAGGTMTGALVNSTNGAASTPALQLTGTPFTGGSATTTKPLALLETAGATSNNWSTSGTMLGVNAPSGFGGRLFDMQVNGSSRVQVSSTGGLELRHAGGANDFIGIGGTTNQLISFHQNALGVSLQLVGDNSGTGAGASVRLGATGYLSFQSTNRVDSGSADIGLARGSAGHLKVTDGSTGAGTLQFGTHSALAGETVTGYITIKDGGGTDRKVAIVS